MSLSAPYEKSLNFWVPGGVW